MARDMYGAMDGAAAWMMRAEWNASYWLLLFAMWVVMMAGMMLPSAAPAMLLYGCVVRKNPDAGNATRQIYAFAAGYLLVWVVFSLVATALQYALARTALLSPMMDSGDPRFGGGLLIAAGVYQFTPFKRACLNACRSPAEFITRHWRKGASGGFYLGAANGLYCLGCCWVLMLLLFVGGVMNLLWIVALTIFVLLEKIAPFGAQGGRISGVLLGALGMWMLARG
jgi:predicted metal-binding membrane protein